MESDPLQVPAELLANPAQTLEWLEAQASGLQKSYASTLFDRQLKAAGQPRSVSGQACVRLCGLVEQLSKANSEELRSWSFSQTVTLQLFNFFVDWNESDHHRSMKLVLDLIVRSIKGNPDLAKSAIKCLDQFLTKGVFILSDIYAGYKSHRKELTQQSDNEVWRSFTVDIFNWMRLQFVCPTAGKFIVSVYQRWRREDKDQPPSPSVDEWYQWLLDFASEEPSLLEPIKNYIFLPLLKADRDEGLRFLGKMGEERAISTACSLDLDTPALLQLAALETGKKIGLVEEPNAKFRVEVSGKVRDMFKRVRGAIHVLKRSIPRARANALKAKLAGKVIKYHEEFLEWYIGFLCSELTPTASYQRHIASLKALGFILRMEGDSSKTWETDDDQQLFFDLFDDKWARALFDLLMDPFEDVRDVAASTLRRLYTDERYRRLTLAGHGSDRRIAETVSEVSQRAEELARRTSRADHSDGASRATQLLYRLLDSEAQRISLLSKMISELERKTSMAEGDLGRAVLDAPLHGDFASLNHIWKVTADLKLAEAHLEAVQLLQSSLVSCCERVWKAVMRVLCDDSPEGHLPQELEEVEGLGTKSLLSFSFRAIHESSNLMRSIVLTARNRSRGGFGTLDCIFSQASTTRRSAGIPSMMTGVLSANALHPSFQHVVEKLIDIAGKKARVSETDGSNLPQVHAYNCLKDIFKNSMLTSMGNKSEEYLPQCLELAASGLRSEVWAIRNCGLLLLRSLIDCLFGSQESKAMIEAGWDGKANRIPYHRYPNLPTVLRTLLMSGHQMLAQTTAIVSAAESVFPALDIIRRAGPPELLRDEIQVHVAVYMSSPVWHVRELAARTLCSCLLHEGWFPIAKKLVQEALGARSSNRLNHVHGVLLTLKFLVQRLGEVAAEHLTADLPNLVNFLAENSIPSTFLRCPNVAAAYLDVINSIWAFEMATSGSLSPLKAATSANSEFVLLRNSAIVHHLYAAAVNACPVELLRELLLDPEVDAESLVTALETIPRLLHAVSTSDEILVGLSALYMDVCRGTSFSDAQILATQNLAELMDQLMQRGQSDRLSSGSLLQWWTALSLRPMNPGLSSAVVGASGRLMAVLSQSQGGQAVDLRSWGRMMSDAGLNDKTFDTRFAAAESLHSFFAAAGLRSTSDEYLPALLALYDALNDDDDEVRDVGSKAVTCIIGKALVPIEAANRLLHWLAQHFGGSAGFRAEVASRVVGHCEAKAADGAAWAPAEDELAAALRFDDSLFVVEEQNLFVDEVRETTRWVHVLKSLWWEDAAGDEILGRLDGWIRAGIVRLGRLVEQEDGPLGWASSPQVFAICTRLVHGSVAMMAKDLASPELREATLRTREALRSHDSHVSRLLTQAWEDKTIDAQI
ncbi:putative death-receptor fusion protein [Hirsutella rhossiliensis]|uniref:Death-receptor fusion protein n=1 Tax=Hirsutella rhossiliensis TaxID=111463 RepID=A0A9P8MVY4_9HYPO|nr:putative death-receptor fusion protein [Hirsutella rhossiliensis]KAH0963073.1 putative death-receptor fusion protein [Hirsutella rhossiliensis]